MRGEKRESEIKEVVFIVKQLSPIVSLTKMIAFENELKSKHRNPGEWNSRKWGREQ